MIGRIFLHSCREKGFGLECELFTEGHLRLEAENGDRNTERELATDSTDSSFVVGLLRRTGEHKDQKLWE